MSWRVDELTSWRVDVLMEDALAHSLTNLERDELAPVLILVLMEDALVREVPSHLIFPKMKS